MIHRLAIIIGSIAAAGARLAARLVALAPGNLAAMHYVVADTGDALAAYYASADVFLFPSLSDTFGNVTLEATGRLDVTGTAIAANKRRAMSSPTGFSAAIIGRMSGS